MSKPIIGIIGKVQPQYEEDIWHRLDEVDESSISYDGLVESFELKNKKFVIFTNKLFKEFIEKSKNF